jgi:hypothetical protein
MKMYSLKYTGKYIIAKIINAAIALLLYLLICAVYTEVVVATYSFGGFTAVTEPEHGYSLLMLIAMTLLIPNKANNTKDIFLLISFFFLLLPATVLHAMQGSNLSGMLLITFGILSVAAFYKIVSSANPSLLTSKSSPIKREFIIFLPLLFAAIVLVVLAKHVRFNFNLSFANVYDYRFDFNDSLSFPLNYLLPLAAGPIMSYLAVITYARRHWLWLIVALSFSVMFYAYSTHKAFLFTPLLAIYIYIIVSKKTNLFRTLALAFAAGGFLALYSSGSLSELVGSTFANRILFIPAQIHYTFFSEFEKVGYLLWAESRIIFGLVKSPLAINSVNHIAELMTGNDSIGANVGWIANGYMNMGIWGIMLYALMISILLLVIDMLALNFDKLLLLAAFSVSVFMLITSSDLLTLLLTGGVLPMLVFLIFIINISKNDKIILK